MQTKVVEEFFKQFQNDLCDSLSKFETKSSFIEDCWQHKGGGGGKTRVMEGGAVFERAGVNYSHVLGSSLPSSATELRPELAGAAFEAMGVSSVIHPRNPFIPTMHVNVRMFKATTLQGEEVWWFGGGFDLTPYYPFDEDIYHWHTTAKNALDKFDVSLYPQFKDQCDKYFYLPHRKETRGVGGIFFDDFNQYGFEKSFQVVKSVAQACIDAYCPIVEKRINTEYTEHNRRFQAYRRGRYVEFNLVYDRGTLFGFKSGGRIESILVSMPPVVNWSYDFSDIQTDQEHLASEYLRPRNWLFEINFKNNSKQLLTSSLG